MWDIHSFFFLILKYVYIYIYVYFIYLFSCTGSHLEPSGSLIFIETCRTLSFGVQTLSCGMWYLLS